MENETVFCRFVREGCPINRLIGHKAVEHVHAEGKRKKIAFMQVNYAEIASQYNDAQLPRVSLSAYSSDSLRLTTLLSRKITISNVT